MAIKKKGLLILIDGFNGILALMIYNFILYLSKIAGIKGLIGRIENTTGSFCINSFIDFGFNTGFIAIGVFLLFSVTFLLGVMIAKLIRKRRGIKF